MARGGGNFALVKIFFNVLARGGGSFDPSRRVVSESDEIVSESGGVSESVFVPYEWSRVFPNLWDVSTCLSQREAPVVILSRSSKGSTESTLDLRVIFVLKLCNLGSLASEGDLKHFSKGDQGIKRNTREIK